ncbi:hypothetical protein ACFOEE_04850 [Pseudoalteromonas fenneropenaei]|uniref:Uncharacterized protein n=1 Tax=Pseudoalteromonas fenneropenaei TaxID=1737459 RepID=A0ABV7CGR1_9GAMM
MSANIDLLTKKLLEEDFERFSEIFELVKAEIDAALADPAKLLANRESLIYIHEQFDQVINMTQDSKHQIRKQLISLKNSSKNLQKYKSI